MRASVLRGGAMVYRDDVPEPVPGRGQVLVAVKACGICGSDLHFAKHGADMLAAGRQMDGHAADPRPSTCPPTSSWATSSAPRCSRPGPTPMRPPPGTLVTSVPVLLSADRAGHDR